MRDLPNLPLNEWIVLALIAESPCHGFAVGSLTAQRGEIGRIWHVSRPMVYHCFTRLAKRGLIVEQGNQDSTHGPQRTVFAATPDACLDIDRWLEAPAAHVRDVRSELLLKLVLLRRRAKDPRALAIRQRDVLVPIEAALRDRVAAEDEFSALLLSWRLEHVNAGLRFLDTLEASEWFDQQP